MSSIFTSFRHLNCLIIMLTLISTSMVSIQHIVLVIFSFFYLFLLSKLAFPNLPSSDNKPVFNNSSILNYYVLFAAFIGLLFPIIYIFWCISEHDQDGFQHSVPHLFLLSSQVFMEGVSFFGGFSLPVRVFVPVFYNSTRMFALVAWVKYEFDDHHGSGATMRLRVGKVIAAANLVLWGYNLFGFLLPVYLPKAFKKYYFSSGGSVCKED